MINLNQIREFKREMGWLCLYLYKLNINIGLIVNFINLTIPNSTKKKSRKK